MKGNAFVQGEIIAKELNLLQNQQANFSQTWYKSSLGKRDSTLFKQRARSSSKGR
jgi:hypothetical protein